MDAGINLESLIRLGAFLGVFLAVALWEHLAPRRRPTFGRRARWPHNLGLLLVDVAVLRILAPGAAIAVAIARRGARLGPGQRRLSYPPGSPCRSRSSSSISPSTSST